MRPAYCGLKRRRGVQPGEQTNPVVLGRKFCGRCGHWRHACDFRPCRSPNGLHTYCRVCYRAWEREYRTRRSPEVRERAREYQAMWYDAKARAAGIPQKVRKASVIDQVERVLLEAAPLLAEVEDYWYRQRLYGDPDYDWNTLAAASGVSERGLHRLRKENRFVRIDTADKLATAIGVPLSLIYPYDESEAA